MSRYIDADALIADMQERYCKPCKYKGEDYHEVKCRACWVDDAINIVDGFANIGIYMVRCKECRHSFINENHPQKPRICGLTKKCGTTKDDWFCADGERRTDG